MLDLCVLREFKGVWGVLKGFEEILGTFGNLGKFRRS